MKTSAFILYSRFTLIDCAGEERFREIHHVYMSPFAIYIITFRVTDIDEDNSRCDATFNSLSDWINRVAAHVERSERRVYLVATHDSAACANPEERRRRSRNLEKRLFDKYSHLLVEVPSRKEDAEETRTPRVVFQIKIKVKEEGDEELKKLRRAIMQNATTERVPMPWFHFLDVIQDAREHRQETGISVMPSFGELFEQVNMMCELNDDKEEFKRMLQFFSDCGEIFFDSHKEFISPYVLLNRAILAKVVCYLVSTKERRCLMPSGELKTHIRHLVSAEQTERVPEERIVDFLTSLNFLIPIHGEAGEEPSFLIPFKLPRSSHVPGALESPRQLCTAIFDFSDSHFHPSPLFLQLLALCQRLQDSSPEAPPASICRNTASFTHGGIPYTISLLDHSPTKIWVHMYRGEPDPDPKTRASTLLHQLNCLVQHLCATHFRSLNFTLQLVCDCSLRRSSDDKDIHLHEYRMATATFPYTMPMRHHLPCSSPAFTQGMVFPRPTDASLPKLHLSSTQCVDFRFATDICILSHKPPREDLLRTLKDLSEKKATRPVILSYRSLEEAHTDCSRQFLLQKDHLAEASVIVILLHEGSSTCKPCREKFQETWGLKKVRLIPIVMELGIQIPSFFDTLMCRHFHDDSFTQVLGNMISLCHFNS